MAKKPKQADPEDAAADGEKPAPPAPRGKKKLIVIAGLALLLAGGGGGAYVMLRGKGETARSRTPEVHRLRRRARDDGQPGRLAQAERTQYLKLKVALEVGDPKLVAAIQPLLPRIEDAFQVYLRELRPSDLDGSAGVYRLKEELLRRVNIAVSRPASMRSCSRKSWSSTRRPSRMPATSRPGKSPPGKGPPGAETWPSSGTPRSPSRA